MNLSHPAAGELELYVIGAHDQVSAPDIASHLRGCEACLDEVRRQARVDVALAELAAQASFCPGCSAVLPAGVCQHCGAVAEAGGFVIERVIVQNAHGRMYLARDRQGAPVALKELAFVQPPHPDALAAFEREGRLLRQLSHPCIPRFLASFRVGEGINTRLYLAQEYVEGESLLARLGAHQFSEGEAREVAGQVLAILEHLQGLAPMVFHRDVKPANLIRRPDGQITLVDFGAARDLGSTVGATLVGTFGYMPLEQLGGIVDATTDLHALGATLCHLLSRREPWRFLEDPTALARLNVSPDFRDFLVRLTARRPADRFPSAAAAARALRAPAARVRRRAGWPWPPVRATAALVAGLGIAVGGGLAFLTVRPARQPVRAPAVETAAVELATAPARPSTYEQRVSSQRVSYKFHRGRLAVDLQDKRYRFLVPGPGEDDDQKVAVLVKVCVSESGGVTSASIVHTTHPALDANILETIQRWRYQPERMDGRAVPFCTHVGYEVEPPRERDPVGPILE